MARSMSRYAPIAALALCASANAQLIVANDQSATTNMMWHVNVSNNVATPILSGANAISWGMAYAPGSNTLYWNNGGQLRSAAFNIGGLTPSAAVQLTVGGSTANVTGMAWWQGRLVGYRSITLPGIYEINPNTGVMDLLWATPSGTDFGGLDSDGSRLYGLNDGTGLQGRGLYELDPGAGAASFIVGYPGGDTDIDGLGIGNGRAYWVNDVGTQSLLVYNLTTNAFEASLTSPFGTGGIFAAGAWVPTPGAVTLFGLAAIAGVRRRR